MGGKRRIRASAAVLGTAVLVASLGACGSDDKTGGESQPSKPAEAVSAYAEAPDGVELTAPGTELELGQSAVIAWEPRNDKVAALELSVDRIERTTFDASFQGWQIDARTAAMTPFFVRAHATNVSEEDLSGAHVLLWARDDAGTLVDVQRFKKRSFRPCPSADLPQGFGPGDEAQLCFVYLIAAGHSLDAVVFPPPAGLDAVTWTGKVSAKVKIPKPLPSPKKSDKSGKSGKSAQ